MSVLRAALVTPLSGPLAPYGKASADALRLWAEGASGLPRPWRGVALDVHDAHPVPEAAVRRAEAQRPHVLFGPYGSSPTVAVARATTRLVWNHGGASSRLFWPEFPNIVNVLSPASQYYAAAVALLTNTGFRGSLGVLFANRGFARDVAGGAVAAALRAGVPLHAVSFTEATVAQALASVTGSEGLLVAGGFEEEVAVARRTLDGAWRALGFVGAGVAEVLAEFGHRREGLLGPAQWVAAVNLEPDEGPDGRWFEAAYRRATGQAPAYPAAQAFAAGVLFARCLRETDDVADEAILGAATRLRASTFFGRFGLDPRTGRQEDHDLLIVQWQEGRRRVVWPPHVAECGFVQPRVAPR